LILPNLVICFCLVSSSNISGHSPQWPFLGNFCCSSIQETRWWSNITLLQLIEYLRILLLQTKAKNIKLNPKPSKQFPFQKINFPLVDDLYSCLFTMFKSPHKTYVWSLEILPSRSFHRLHIFVALFGACILIIPRFPHGRSFKLMM